VWWHLQGRKKIKLVQLFTEMNLTVLISDVDTVWMRNPFEYFKRYPEADILTSSDFLAWTYGDEGLEDAKVAQAAYNIGIMMFSPKSVDFAKQWVDMIEADGNLWDQNAFNQCGLLPCTGVRSIVGPPHSVPTCECGVNKHGSSIL
jgi:arabinosyltransferase